MSLFYDNFVLLRRLDPLLKASTQVDGENQADPNFSKHITTIRTLLAMAILSPRPDVYALLFAAYAFDIRYRFYTQCSSTVKAPVINCRAQVELIDLASACFNCVLSFDTYETEKQGDGPKATAREAGFDALMSDALNTCDTANCDDAVRIKKLECPPQGEMGNEEFSAMVDDVNFENARKREIRPSSRARISRTGAPM